VSRGGARTGAGRPLRFGVRTERRSLSLPPETWNALEALAIVLDVTPAQAAAMAIEGAALEVGLQRKTPAC
jgi:hypothetical protein